MSEKPSDKQQETIKGYKGFDNNFVCDPQGGNPVQYEVGKSQVFEGVLELCRTGLHFCENALHVLKFYKPGSSRFAEVVASGVDEQKTQGDSKRVCSKIEVVAEIKLPDIINAGIKFIFSKINWDAVKQNSSGDSSTSATSGNYSTSATSGYCSTSATSGDSSTSATSGNYSTSATSGDSSTSATSGYCSTSATSGYYSTSATSGYYSTSATSGYYSTSATSGDYSTSATSGDCSTSSTSGDSSTSATSGDSSKASAVGKNSIAIANGRESKGMGALGNYIVLTEYDAKGNMIAKMERVDGKKIKANVWYQLVKGKFVEAK